jgi:hypothetical protein
MAPLPSKFTGLYVLGTALFYPIAASAASRGCNADNCARAVTGTRRGEGHVASAKADCSSYLATTVLADPV